MIIAIDEIRENETKSSKKITVDPSKYQYLFFTNALS